MNMTEKEAEILDYIVKESLKKSSLFAIDLKSLDGKEDPISTHEDFLEKSYKSYFAILKESGVVNVECNGGKTRITPILIKTKEFIKNGGFMSIYNTMQLEVNKKNQYNDISFKKLRYDYMISKFQANTQLIPLILSLLSIGISLWALFAN